jgi:hypothetical protein
VDGFSFAGRNLSLRGIFDHAERVSKRALICVNGAAPKIERGPAPEVEHNIEGGTGRATEIGLTMWPLTKRGMVSRSSQSNGRNYVQ